MPSAARTFLTALAVLTGPGCGTGPSPVTFPAPLSAVPPPGLCRILSEGGDRDAQLRRCDAIEWTARPRDLVVYRPDDGSRIVFVCYMSPAERGLIDAVDAFDIDTGELVAVVQRHGEPPPEGGCQGVVWEWRDRP